MMLKRPLLLSAIIILIFTLITADCAHVDNSEPVIPKTQFSVESFKISKTILKPEEATTILVLVKNTSNASGVYKVDLKLNGEVYDSQTVTLDAEQQTEVSFGIFFQEVGVYELSVNERSASITVEESPAIYIDDPIILETSDPLSPIDGGMGEVYGEYLFDLHDVPMIQNDNYNDFRLTYLTPHSADENAWVFNYTTQSWDQIGFALVGGGSLTIVTTQYHLFSAKGLTAGDYLNDAAQMKLKGGISSPHVQAIKINTDYHSVPILAKDASNFAGLAYDGQSFWVSSNWSDKLYNVSLSGSVLKEFAAPSRWPFGLAFDGQNIWLADGSNRIFKLSRDGSVLGQFSVPTDFPGGLTWGENKLWLAEYEGPDLRLFGIDPEASCSTGVAIIADTFETPGGGSWGLAWDGTHILVASDALYKLTTKGVVVKSYDLPVYHAQDITWDGDAVWILNYGPNDFVSRDPVVTRFKLR